MEKAVFNVPKMYADHHVEAVRNALVRLQGVEDVYASSAFKQVVVTYNPKRLNPSAIEEALKAAGYAPGDELELPEILESKEDNSSWFTTIERITWTNQRDLEMSGDFRKY